MIFNIMFKNRRLLYYKSLKNTHIRNVYEKYKKNSKKIRMMQGTNLTLVYNYILISLIYYYNISILLIINVFILLPIYSF